MSDPKELIAETEALLTRLKAATAEPAELSPEEQVKRTAEEEAGYQTLVHLYADLAEGKKENEALLVKVAEAEKTAAQAVTLANVADSNLNEQKGLIERIREEIQAKGRQLDEAKAKFDKANAITKGAQEAKEVTLKYNQEHAEARAKAEEGQKSAEAKHSYFLGKLKRLCTLLLGSKLYQISDEVAGIVDETLGKKTIEAAASSGQTVAITKP